MKINEAIQKMMESRSFTNADLAEKVGVTPQAVHYYINGQKGKPTSVTVDTAFDIAEALDYTLVFVPSTRDTRLPDGSVCIDERLTERRKTRRALKD